MRGIFQKYLMVLVVGVALTLNSHAGPAVSDFFKGVRLPFEIMEWQVGQWVEYKIEQNVRTEAPSEIIVRFAIVDRVEIDDEIYYVLERAENLGKMNQLIFHSFLKPYRHLYNLSLEQMLEELQPVKQYVRYGNQPIYKVDLETARQRDAEALKEATETKANNKYRNMRDDISGMLKATETVSVPAGEFTAYHFLRYDDKFGVKTTVDSYSSPDVPLFGVVKKETKSVNMSAKEGKGVETYVKEYLVAYGIEGGQATIFTYGPLEDIDAEEE